jgi:hypothetical protein
VWRAACPGDTKSGPEARSLDSNSHIFEVPNTLRVSVNRHILGSFFGWGALARLVTVGDCLPCPLRIYLGSVAKGGRAILVRGAGQLLSKVLPTQNRCERKLAFALGCTWHSDSGNIPLKCSLLSQEQF